MSDDQQRLDELEAELTAHATRPLTIRGVDRDTGELITGTVYADHTVDLIETAENGDSDDAA